MLLVMVKVIMSKRIFENMPPPKQVVVSITAVVATNCG